QAGVGHERLWPEAILKLRAGHGLGTPLQQGPQALEGLGRQAARLPAASQLAASRVEDEVGESCAHGFTQPSRNPNGTETNSYRSGRHCATSSDSRRPLARRLTGRSRQWEGSVESGEGSVPSPFSSRWFARGPPSNTPERRMTP